MSDKSFATSLSCMDGRVQIPMINLIKEKYSVDFVDTITAPGIDKVISDGDIESIKKSVMISVSFGCAGNPVSNDEHFIHIKKSVELVKSWNLDAEVVGVWIDENFTPKLI